ncbi:MAG: glycosyltransferase [Tannerella sp.]|nr:glycosyltransferase [Tannerella sp.]
MIPHIIHQVWESGTERLPKEFAQFAGSWKEHHPEWQYEFWDKKRMDTFVRTYYPKFAGIYFGYRFNAQRWHAIRYLILFKMGGVYVDFDTECLESMDKHIEGKTFCFGLDPEEHARMLHQPFLISDAWIASESNHPFLKQIIERLADTTSAAADRINIVLETTGTLMLSKTYHNYSGKDEITLFPASVTSPWSHREVQMFLRNEISESILEEKLQNAIFLHYHWRSWQTDTSRKKADVLYFSVSSGNGGAPRAAYRIHSGLRQYGIDSVMLVQSAGKVSTGVYVASSPKNGFIRDQAPLRDYPDHKKGLFTPAITGINLQKYIRFFNPEIIQLHWISSGGFIRIEDMAKIKQKIVWRFPDIWAMTGGCHFSGECRGYTEVCGKCPHLGSDKSDDLSHQIWQRKYDAFKNLDITVVVPTLWMKKVTQTSSLFGKHRIEMIPNGLDTDLFSPLDKDATRKILKLPQHKKIILYGAYNAVKDSRKGFSLLFEALQRLSFHHSDYEVVIFGANDMPMKLDIPVHFLGYIQDHLLLQIAYSTADVMLVPSIEEPFGQTVIEAMACAVPVVVFSDTGPADIIDHKINGYVATHNDSEDLANGIEWVLNDDMRRMQLSLNARRKVLDTYDIRLIAEQYAILYNSLK